MELKLVTKELPYRDMLCAVTNRSSGQSGKHLPKQSKVKVIYAKLLLDHLSHCASNGGPYQGAAIFLVQISRV
jgi:hypothetical protein